MASDDGPVRRVAVVQIVNEKGLHARASAKFAALAETFDATVMVAKDAYRVNATSIMGLLTLAATQGSHIEIIAQGAEAEAAVGALERLVAERFDEPR
ncbi:MAG: HPr family phosphocarrier protein [Pseudomonadota bacterium]